MELPEVTLLRDARPSRPENSVGIGDFWYEPEVWSLPLSPPRVSSTRASAPTSDTARSTAATSRNTLKDCSDEEVAAALQELVRHSLLVPEPKENLASYAVLSVTHFDANTDSRSN